MGFLEKFHLMRKELVLVTISIIFAYATCIDGEPRLPVVGDIPAGLPGFMYLGRRIMAGCSRICLGKLKRPRPA